MQLAKNEHIVKEWNYADVKHGMIDLNQNHVKLTVTNKRIVHETKDKLKIERDEIMVKDVKSVSTLHARQGLPVGKLLLAILGLVVFILGIAIEDGELFMPIGVAGLVLMALMIVAIIIALTKGSFGLLIKTRGAEGSQLSAGAIATGFTGQKKSQRIKVKVKNDIALEIVDCLGAIIIDGQDETVATVESYEATV